MRKIPHDWDESVRSAQSRRSQILTEDEIKAAYMKARELFLSGDNESKKQLINLYLDKVLVYNDYVEVYINALPLFIMERMIKKYRNSGQSAEFAEIFGRGKTPQTPILLSFLRTERFMVFVISGFSPI